MRAHYYILAIFISVFVPSKILSQKNGKNYPLFEYKDFHFGTMLGTNISSYSYKPNTTAASRDSITQLSINPAPGLAIHIPVISWNPHPVFNVRFVPSISFHETVFEYTYIHNGKLKSQLTRTQPTLLNFPILLKMNTRRLNNFSAYAITGFSYSIDLTNQENVQQSNSGPIVKTRRNDFAYHVGGGFDFYLPYFKFGIDIKLTNGINNLLIQDHTFFSDPLESLRSHIWWFSLTFEG